MIRYIEGNILDDDAEALVNPVNCVGVMGAGLAKAFKERFPNTSAWYRKGCDEGKVKPGEVYIIPIRLGRNRQWVAHVPTKDHWRDPSRLEWVQGGLDGLADFVREMRLRSVAIPMLGCGLGGLAWSDVRPLIERAFAGLPDVDVRVYGPAAEARP